MNYHCRVLEANFVRDLVSYINERIETETSNELEAEELGRKLIDSVKHLWATGENPDSLPDRFIVPTHFETIGRSLPEFEDMLLINENVIPTNSLILLSMYPLEQFQDIDAFEQMNDCFALENVVDQDTDFLLGIIAKDDIALNGGAEALDSIDSLSKAFAKVHNL